MVVTLVGYRGSGKSLVAGVLAQRLGWALADADHEIERRAGRSIPEIFQADGETGFRTLERDVMADLLGRDQLVVAAGGGAVLDDETRRRMEEAGPVVWLRARIDTLHARITRDMEQGHARPALTAAGGGREEIEAVLARREPIYRDAADVTIDTDEKDVETLAAEILRAIQPWLRPDRPAPVDPISPTDPNDPSDPKDPPREGPLS